MLLEREIKEVESALHQWQTARRWMFENLSIVTDRDRRDVSRKLMDLDWALGKLGLHIPEAVVDGDEECPQELAGPLSVYLIAAGAMAGQNVSPNEAALQAAKEESRYTFSDSEQRAGRILEEWLTSPALPGAVAAHLCDAFEAGYKAALDRKNLND